mmetsp:Transcript_21337/g.46616  ORF Transcript_21337/g.46616 Transcript_21337/m.46616 type:complete len:147 (-) Transcript_21337:113-553(-)
MLMVVVDRYRNVPMQECALCTLMHTCRVEVHPGVLGSNIKVMMHGQCVAVSVSVYAVLVECAARLPLAGCAVGVYCACRFKWFKSACTFLVCNILWIALDQDFHNFDEPGFIWLNFCWVMAGNDATAIHCADPTRKVGGVGRGFNP